MVQEAVLLPGYHLEGNVYERLEGIEWDIYV